MYDGSSCHFCKGLGERIVGTCERCDGSGEADAEEIYNELKEVGNGREFSTVC